MNSEPTAFELSRGEHAPVRWWPQLAAVLLIVVETGWVVPWYRLVSGLSAPQPIWKISAVLAGGMIGAYAVSLGLDALRLIRKAKLTVLSILLILNLVAANLLLLRGMPVSDRNGVLNVDPGFLSTIVFVIWLWRRGIGLGSETVRPKMAWSRFQVGMVGLMAHTFIAGNLGEPTVGIGGFVAYLFTGLLAVILSRISYVSLTRSARKNPFDRRWALTAAVGLGFSLSAAALAAGLLTGQFRSMLDALRIGLQWLSIAVLFLLSLPVLLLSYLFLPLAPMLQRFLERFAVQSEPVLYSPYAFDPYPLIEETVQRPLPVQIQMICFWTMLAAVVVLVILRVRQTYQQDAVLIIEGPESLLQAGDAQRLAKQAFREFFESLVNRFRRVEYELPAEAVRRIYVRLLSLSRARGHPRPENRTPLEFLPEIEAVFPEADAEVGKITRAYLDVRYGEKVEKPDVVAAVEQDFQRILDRYAEKPDQSTPD